MKEVKLKNCPFCGSSNVGCVDGRYNEIGVFCFSCDSRGAFTYT